MGTIDKTIGFTFQGDDEDFEVRVEISSAPDDLFFNNLERSSYEGYTYLVKVSSEPPLPQDDLNRQSLIFILFHGGEQRLGFLQENELIDLPKNRLTQALGVVIIEALLLKDDDIVYHAGII